MESMQDKIMEIPLKFVLPKICYCTIIFVLLFDNKWFSEYKNQNLVWIENFKIFNKLQFKHVNVNVFVNNVNIEVW